MLIQLRFFLALTLVLSCLAVGFVWADDGPISLEEIERRAQEGPFQPSWSSLSTYQIPEWYKDAKFGIFIHWGVYSVPAYGNEWYPRFMYLENSARQGKNYFQHHRDTYGPQDQFGYKDFIPMFKAEKFDPAAWVDLFEKSGARYIVPVAEHHDGFAMYDSDQTEWTSVKMGPKRDVIGELEKAARAKGLRFGVSSHRAFNWAYYARRKDFDTIDPRYAGLYGRYSDYHFRMGDHKEEWPAFDDEFKTDWLLRTCELVDKYLPDLMWFDFGIAKEDVKSAATNPFAPELQKYAAYYYNSLAKDGKTPAVINYKFNAFEENSAVLDLERSKMDAIREPFWQTDTSVSSNSWGYIEDHKYKPVDRLVDDLVDIVSKNGCMLLNVGPRADGTIPEHEQMMLLEIGDWLKVNGEGIYGTRPWSIYGEGPTGTAVGHLSEKKNKPFTAEDLRFTRNGNHLYVTLLDWPKSGQVSVKSLGKSSSHAPTEISAIHLLGSEESITFQHQDEALVVDLPDEKFGRFAHVLRLELKP